MRRACLFLLQLTVLTYTVACGSQSPTGPSGSSGATLTGSIVAPGGAARAGSGVQSVSANAAAGQGLTVSVVGTDLSAPVNGANTFSLGGLPAGPLRLRFSSGSSSAELPLAPVESTEAIEIAVSMEGSLVTLESERRSSGREVQLEGRVEALPVAPAGSLIVAGQAVTTTPTTKLFLRGSPATFSAVLVGMRVHVKGQADGAALAASVIMIQNTKTDLPGEDEDEEDDDADQDESASIEGVLTSKSGSGNVLDLTVDGTTVHTDATTKVQRRGDVQDLTVLELGMRLHVVGDRQPDKSIQARRIQIKGDAPGGAVQIEGSMGGVKGTCPSLSFGVNGYTVVTGGLTTFMPECSTFKSGTKAKVQGVLQSNGSILAAAVTKS